MKLCEKNEKLIQFLLDRMDDPRVIENPCEEDCPSRKSLLLHAAQNSDGEKMMKYALNKLRCDPMVKTE